MPGGRAAIFLAGPVSAFVDTPAERLAKSLIIAAIMSIQDGQHPRVMQDLLKSYVPRSGAPVGATRPRPCRGRSRRRRRNRQCRQSLKAEHHPKRRIRHEPEVLERMLEVGGLGR